ncbi:hypothetical protein PBAL39_12678 [Pedobacter sp. BAL39]|uniref:hypothetical protein n=1 Tax=Pedobacter sp. BAL39 TaxID=391596 RepID=UPI000155A4AF|nr:hypothetical protein [Pedobacter sp. BAL39]EDM34322.1 hypothetical protein PBAL39_12678 [Pedobacter sp. BAL39]
MENQDKNPYSLFSTSIFKDWKENGVKYVKLVELESDLAVQFFELIPNSEIPDEAETIYHIDSEDVADLLLPAKNVKFLVHDIYLEGEE